MGKFASRAYGANASRLYEGVDLLPDGFLTAAHEYVQYGIGALILLQTVLIVLLLIQNRRHLRAREHIQKQYADVTHAARLMLVGEITASVAHEVAQPMSAILSNVEAAQLLLGKPQPDVAAVLQILDDIRNDDLRADAIVRRLRVLLRKRELHFEVADLNTIISHALAVILPDAARRHISIRTALHGDLPRVCADPVLLQQVLLNLLVNALDAMADTPQCERALLIRTACRDESFVEVAVLDSGSGIPPEHAGKIFDSFFTTKRGGMGLGLSIARSIVRMHGGEIWVEPRSSGGAVFTFTVPIMGRSRPVALSA
jgi:signal transduction histidine kinase